MKLDSDEYERLVSEIVDGIRTVAPELASMSLGCGRRNRIMGASSYKHQIDVSLVGATYIYLIECKRWEKEIGVAEVMVLLGRCVDIMESHPNVQVRCIFATQVGATRGGIVLARHFGLELEVVSSAQEFGMRIGRRVSVAAASRVVAGDSVIAEVSRKQP